jgi:hypothetical protein
MRAVCCRSGKVLKWSEQPGRKSWTHAVYFAWNALPKGSGIVSVGDSLSVTEEADWNSLPVQAKPAKAAA